MILKPIPNTRGFYASDTGQIFDSAGKERNYYRNGDGYVTASVLLTNGKWITFGVQRLIALAHIPATEDPVNLTVNHIDGNIENNALSNLEWVSVALNNIHASLLRGCKSRPTILAKSPEGVYEFISNIYVAAKRFGVDLDIIWGCIRDDSLLEGWKLSYINNSMKIPETLKKKRKLIGPKKAIKMMDIHSQEVSTYSSLAEAAAVHSVTASHIYTCISTAERVCLFKKSFLIVGEGEEFPILNQERYEQLLNIGGKEVLAFNVNEKTFRIYPSAAEFIRDNSLSKKAITVDLKKERLREVKGWWYTYFTGKNVERLKSLLAVQGKL